MGIVFFLMLLQYNDAIAPSNVGAMHSVISTSISLGNYPYHKVTLLYESHHTGQLTNNSALDIFYTANTVGCFIYII